ncbi:SH3 domain-containing protein [Clostridium estertheticum]|uniref:SH3 domain-containing protein n=1 Tax=Clostridium estertheticum TaxID=238834 RepID=UPI001CD0F7D1|nr:SH3 domain-containing protein [Clostridium estertheticum]MBZ9687016.1 SH3 domain-containing protein [Clostridium estertheticum]
MDILDKPYDHVVIFDKWGTYNGTYGAFTYESTPDCIYGGIQGTKKYFISMNEINKGYLPGRYVNIGEDTVAPAPSLPNVGNFAQISKVDYAANFRATSSQSSAIIGTIPKSTIIYLIDYSSGWYQVNYNGQVGWVSSTLITLVPTGKYVTLIYAYQLNIRNSPTITGAIVGILIQKQYAEVTGYSSDGNWLKININGIQGYASRKYLNYIQ